MERKVIVSNLPELLDEWTIKQLVPCANLFVSIEINPGDSTKMIVETETREHALQVAQQLNGCEFLDSIIQARCVVTGKRGKTDQGSGDTTSTANASSGLSEGKVAGTRDENTSNDGGTASASSQRFDLPEAADSDTSSPREVPKTPAPVKADATALKGGRIPKTNAVSPKSFRCRFCSGNHETYGCREFAEYFSVSLSDQAVTDPTAIGYSWPDAAVHKIIDMSAGPVIEFFERTFFKEELTRDELLVVFAYLTNKIVCYECGAAGHEYDSRNLKPLCGYLPMAVRPTNEIMGKRQRMCKRMVGVLRKHPAGTLQQIAATESLNFRKAIRSVPSVKKSVKRQAEVERRAGSSNGAKQPKLNRK